MGTERDYSELTAHEAEAFWKEVTWENAEIASGAIESLRRETAKNLICAIQDAFQRLGFGPVGTPTIAVYAEELFRLARLPHPEHECPSPSEEVDA